MNLRVLRPFHKELIQNQSLLSSMKPELDNVFQVLTRSMPHQLSFEKYRQRLGSSGIQIPISLMHKIHDHLNYQERRNKTDR
ncbi:MAG: hypothetical protein H3C43_10730 [Leptonema sp. (in: Bacteria)]|nr:hypothetical protein [Leptonema sp. (in: bacteria)]